MTETGNSKRRGGEGKKIVSNIPVALFLGSDMLCTPIRVHDVIITMYNMWKLEVHI